MGKELNHQALERPAREALIAGRDWGLLWTLPNLLWRAGFCVDVITTTRLIRSSRFVRSLWEVENSNALIETAVDRICAREKPYDWVIAADDETVQSLGSICWPEGLQPRNLPLQDAGRFPHLFSKIGLSRALAAGGVQTPAFHVTGDCAEAAAWARLQGYPVLLKVDASSGGGGVYQCNCDADMAKLEWLFAMQPMLVQKKIEGREFDLSAIYLDNQLVHFSCARIEAAYPRFGASILRRYYPLQLVDAKIFDELTHLQQALGINGFTNIACIEAADGSGRYYFEVDLRANAWVDHPRFFGEDPAERIRNWYSSRLPLAPQRITVRGKSEPITIPYFLRVSFGELLLNRHRVWRYIPFDDRTVVLRLLVRAFSAKITKLFLPRTIRRRLRSRLDEVLF